MMRPFFYNRFYKPVGTHRMRPHVYFIKTVGTRCTTSLRSFIADARVRPYIIFLPRRKMCGVAPWCASADAREPPSHIFSIAREGDKGKILKWRTRHARIAHSSGC